jgi:hypothetical protein
MDTLLAVSLIIVSILLLREWYYRYYRYRRETAIKPLIHVAEDGSVLIEWITRDVRFYLTIEKDINESSWGFLSRYGFMSSGELPKELIDLIKWNKL